MVKNSERKSVSNYRLKAQKINCWIEQQNMDLLSKSERAVKAPSRTVRDGHNYFSIKPINLRARLFSSSLNTSSKFSGGGFEMRAQLGVKPPAQLENALSWQQQLHCRRIKKWQLNVYFLATHILQENASLFSGSFSHSVSALLSNEEEENNHWRDLIQTEDKRLFLVDGVAKISSK